MKVLILANSDSGLYQFRKEIIESISKENDVICSVPDSDGYIHKLEDLGCKCIPVQINRRGMNAFKDFVLLKTYITLLKDIKPNIVLTYTIKPNVYGGIACQIKKIPYLSNITGLGTAIENGGLSSSICLTLYRIGLKRADCVFFQNKQNLSLFSKLGIVNNNTMLIPGSGVNIQTHSYEEYPPDGSNFHFLFVGRVMKDKGIEELLSACEQLHYENNNVFLDVVGGCDEDYIERLSDYAKRGIIKYHGHQDDIHTFYSKAHCVVLPSYHEGMANVMLEAASTGRPVITTEIPGCRETFDEGITGYGCKVKDVDSLVVAMRKMYDTPWNERRKMGIAGREKVKKEFDRQIIVDAYNEQIGLAANI